MSIKIKAYLQNIAKIYHNQVQLMRRIYKANVKIKRNKTEFCKQNSTSRLIFESDL